jgi:hypothetical protein
MRLEKKFVVDRPSDVAAQIAAREQTLVALFPDSETEIIESSETRRTTRTRYRALGREGIATFHFTYLTDGTLEFEKVCDGNVWRALTGRVSFQARGKRTRVTLEMQGRTKAFVPELAIRGPMQQQIEQMSDSLRKCIESEEG